MPLTMKNPTINMFCNWQVLSIYLRIKLKNVKYICMYMSINIHNNMYSIYNTFILRGLLK